MQPLRNDLSSTPLAAEDDLNISLAVFFYNNYGGSFTESLETHDF